MPQKRPYERSSEATQLIEIFEDLAHVEEGIRLKAAQRLITTILPGKEHVSSTETPSQARQERILARLFRGLGSGRKAARLGFSVALTEILSLLSGGNQAQAPTQIDAETIITIWLRESELEGRQDAQARKDILFGRLFGAEAIIRSGALYRLDNGLESWRRLLDSTLEVAQSKLWLREEAGRVVFCSLQNDQGLPTPFVQAVIDALQRHDLCHSPEGVAIWIRAQQQDADVEFPKKVFSHKDPLRRKELSRLATILISCSALPPAQERSSEQEAPANGKGKRKVRSHAGQNVWSPKLHFVWDVVCKASQKAGKKQTPFHTLWQTAVDEGLFAPTASDERKYWGFSLLRHQLAIAPSEYLITVLSENAMRCWSNHLAKTDRKLHALAKQCHKALLDRVKLEPPLAVDVVRALIKEHQLLHLDALTKTKTLETLLAQVPSEDVAPLLEVYQDVIRNPWETSMKAALMLRQHAADQLVAIVRSSTSQNGKETQKNGSLVESGDAILSVLNELATWAYFDVETDTAVNPATRDTFRNRLLSSTTSLMTNETAGSRIAASLVQMIWKRSLEDEAHSLILRTMDADVQKTLQDAVANMGRSVTPAETTTHDSRPMSRALLVLQSVTALLAFNGEADAIEILSDLQELSRNFEASSSADSMSHDDVSLIEILIGLLHRPSQQFRRLVGQTFPALAPHLTRDGLASLIRIVLARENLAGQKELFDADEDIDPASGTESSDDEQDPDVQELEEPSSATSPEASEEGEPVSGKKQRKDDDEDVEGDEAAAFDAKLAEALGTRRADHDLAVQESESSESDLDDEQMKAFDEPLANIFRARKAAQGQKNEHKDARQSMTVFKTRVLDLVEIYIKLQHQNPLALSLLQPLLTLAQRSNVKTLSDRACTLVREFMKLYKLQLPQSVKQSAQQNKNAVERNMDVVEPNSDTVMQDITAVIEQEPSSAINGSDETPTTSAAEIEAQLTAVHDLAIHGEGSNAFRTACSQASILLVKALLNHNGGDMTPAWSLYAATGVAFVQDSDCRVRSAFFNDWLNWCTSARDAYGRIGTVITS